MSKADNMLAILWLLKTHKRMTAKTIAETLEINIRTVYRYIDGLCVSGVPIEAEAGHDGGYRLPEHFRDAPLFFDIEEQKALAQAAVFAQEAGYPYGEVLDRAVTKLQRYANREQWDQINRRLSGFDVVFRQKIFAAITEEEARFALQEQAIQRMVPYFLFGYGRAIQVVEPNMLKERMVTAAEGLLEHYRNS